MSTSSVLISLPSRQVGVLLAECLLDEQRPYVTNFDADWTTVTVSGNTVELSRQGENHIKSLIAQIAHDISTSTAYLHCSNIPLLCSASGESDVKSVEDLFHVEIRFTQSNLTIEQFSSAVRAASSQRHTNENVNYLMRDLGNATVSGQVTREQSTDRPEEFTPSVPCVVRWSYQQPNGTLIQFSLESSQIMESLFQYGGSEVTLEGTQCFVDFHAMKLLVSDTGQTAKLQRTPAVSQAPEHRVLMRLTGTRSCTDNARTNLTGRLRRGHKTIQILCASAGASEIQQQIRNFCRQYCIELKFTDTAGLSITGAESHVQQVCSLVQAFAQTISSRLPPVSLQEAPAVASSLTQQAASLAQQVVSPLHHFIPRFMQHPQIQGATPSLWQPQIDSCEFNSVPSSSPEWGEIVQQMRSSLPTVQVLRIDRVQNQPLWEKYSLEGRQMSERNQGAINEKYLFHGTSRTDPYVVARCETGIDFRYSSRERQLMWGSGAYFAIKASYSDRFSYKLTPNQRQMMLVSVLTGHSFRFGTQKKPDLTRPPPFSGNRLYDTVYGESAESGIYIVYDHCKSCPAYIITYTK